MSRIPILYTTGLNSICEDGNNIIMLDYDIKDIVKIKTELNNLIDNFRLSSFYIISSNNGYNAFCLDKVSLHELYKIYLSCENVDKDFIYLTLRKGFSTIRFGDDKFYTLTILSSNNNIRIKSLAHRNAILLYYKVPVIDFKNFDNSKNVQVCRYENIKYGTDVLI